MRRDDGASLSIGSGPRSAAVSAQNRGQQVAPRREPECVRELYHHGDGARLIWREARKIGKECARGLD